MSLAVYLAGGAAVFALYGFHGAEDVWLVMLYALVIDIVAFTADRTGVLRSMIPA
jgi:hypothetical protein